jgi:pimeloyl-ACP methyl ester carboxylesterase
MRRLVAALIVLTLSAGVVVAPVAAAPTVAHATVALDQRFVDVAGVRTAYAQLGPDSAIPLLLLNGTGSPMSQWDPALLDSLALSRRVVVYDYPGLGASAPVSGRLTFDRLADHASALLAVLGYEQADVLGWSMGGFVAQRLVARDPDRVHALVLAGTNPGGPRTVLGPEWVQDQDSDPDASARGYVRTNYPAGARDRGWASVRRVNAAIESGRYPPDRVPARTFDAMVAAEGPWLASGANLVDLRSVAVPTLVITGTRDVVTPPANSRLIASTVPGSRLRLVAGAGHAFLFQDPSGTARLLAGFLD